jgi:hypothetical protein
MSAAPKLAPLESFDHKRFYLPDLQTKGTWLLGRLKEFYKNSSEIELLSWLRGVMTSDQFLFVHTENAIGLAQITREALSAKPKVKELFVLCASEDDYEQGAYLYSVLRDWAAAVGASEFIVETFTDVPRDMIKLRAGGMFKRDQVFVKLG